jgi:hypothetical protein
VILVTAMQQGPTPPGARRLERELGVDRRTLDRWKEWWQEVFPLGEFWPQARRQLHPNSPSSSMLPLSLLEKFSALESSDNLLRALRFLAAASTPFEISVHASLWPC